MSDLAKPPEGYKVKREMTKIGPGYKLEGPNGFGCTMIGGKGRRAIEIYRQAVEKCWEHKKAPVPVG